MKSSGVLAVTGLLLCFVILASARRVPLADDPAAKAEADAKAKAVAEGGDVAKAIADAKAKATSTGGQATAKADAKASATGGGGGAGMKEETKPEAPKTKEEPMKDDKETKPTAPKDTDAKPKDEPKGKKDDKDTKPADDKETKPKDDTTTGKPKETPKKGSGKPGDGAIDAFLTYTGRCLGPSAPASECAGLSGALCSRKDVKCSQNKTEFLDESGAVVATGTNSQRLICYTDKTKPCLAA